MNPSSRKGFTVMQGTGGNFTGPGYYSQCIFIKVNWWNVLITADKIW